MNTKISVFAICIEAIISLLLFNLHDCTFNNKACITTFVLVLDPVILNRDRRYYQSDILKNTILVRHYIFGLSRTILSFNKSKLNFAL